MPASPGGRGLPWRVGMLAGGLLLAAFGGALVWWPQLLGWIVAGAFGLLGLFCVASALFARGR